MIATRGMLLTHTDSRSLHFAALRSGRRNITNSEMQGTKVWDPISASGEFPERLIYTSSLPCNRLARVEDSIKGSPAWSRKIPGTLLSSNGSGPTQSEGFYNA
jgi:hypothetical protein